MCGGSVAFITESHLPQWVYYSETQRVTQMCGNFLGAVRTVSAEAKRLCKQSLRLLSEEGVQYFTEKLWWYIKHTTEVELNVLLGSVASASDKQQNLWVFGGTYNGKFTQNAKYLFLYVANNCQDITPVWVSPDRSVVAELQQHGYLSYHVHSWQGLTTLLRADCVFYTNNLGNFGALWGLTGGATRVNLWHGNPIKRFPYSWQMTKRRDADFVVVTSSKRSLELFSEIPWTISPKSRFEKQQALPSGYPRNDILFRDVTDFMIGLDESVYHTVQQESQTSTIVGYFPTYRPYEAENPLMNSENLSHLNTLLGELDCKMMLKPHHSEELNIREYDNFITLPSEFDIYPIMDTIDILITDYSSVYFGFLLLDRPIILFPYDIERYRDENGFMMDYSELAGPVAETVDELFQEIEQLAVGDDEYSDARLEVQSEFYDDVDGESSKRIYEEIQNRTNR